MNLMRWVCLCWCVTGVLGDASVRRAGWLDRVVSYFRTSFIEDVKKTAPVEIRASLMRVPAAKDEAKLWDFPSVERLLYLLGASPRAAPVRRALRRALRPSAPTRRFISKKQSWKLFPSHGKNHPNEIYYDFDPTDSSSSEEIVSSIYSDDSVLVLDNPVEARLPSAKISVKLLRDILEARAKAARMMPSTVKSTIPWVPMNKSPAGHTMDTGFEELRKDGLNSVDNLVKWMKISKVIEGTQEAETQARKLFEDAKDQAKIELEKFKQVVSKLAAEQKKTSDVMEKLLADGFSQLIAELKPRYTMETGFEELKKNGFNSVDNLVKWMKNSKVIEGTQEAETKARKLFEDAKDQAKIELEKFKQVVSKLAAEQKKTSDEMEKLLADGFSQLIAELKPRYTMDTGFEELKKNGFNSVDNLVKWMKNSKVIEGTQEAETKARKLFEDAKDQAKIELEKFKQVVSKLAEEQKKTSDVMEKLLADGFTQLIAELKPRYTMDTGFEELKKNGFNSVDNLVKWMKNTKVIEGTQEAETKARKLFEDAKDQAKIELEKFKQVVSQLAEEQKKTSDVMEKLLAEGFSQLIDELKPRYTMDTGFEELKKNGFNSVDNLVKWMKNTKVIEGTQEAETQARKLFEDAKDQAKIELEKFKQVVSKLAAEQKKTSDEMEKQLADGFSQLIAELKPRYTMETGFEELKKNGFNSVENLVKWMKNSKVIEDTQEDETKKLFEDAKDQAKIDLEKFKQVVSKLAAAQKKTSDVMEKLLADGFSQLIAELKPSHTMDTGFEELEKDGFNSVENLLKWMKTSKVIEDTQEEETKKLFEDAKDQAKIELEEFKHVVSKLAETQSKTPDVIEKQLAGGFSQLIAELKGAS